jgi:hypothetical protein
VNRRRWILVGGLLAALAAVVAWIARPRPSEAFPLAELVPADAVLYAGFRDYREIESIRTPWSDEIRRRLDPARPHLAGPIAFYVDRHGEWIALARLTRASAIIAGAEVENGAAVAAQTPAALARHKAREGSLDRVPEFAALGSRIFLNLELLKPRGRLRDFSAAGLELRSTDPFVFHGRALYRGGLFRTYLERYVHAPRRGSPEGSAPAQVALTEYFPRVWEEVTHDVLNPLDCEKAEREAMALSRDILEGRPFREFLGRLGPGCGAALVPTPQGKPALVAWIDLPDKPARDKAQAALHHAIQDGIRVRRDRGLAPVFDVAAEGTVTRVKYVSSITGRLYEAFSPAFTFEKDRFVFTTCAAALSAPAVGTGDSHGAITVEIGPLLDALRALAPIAADDEFRKEAELKATALYLKTFTPGMLTALKKQFPHPADLAAVLDAQKAQFEVKALEEISKGNAWQDELKRLNASIDVWSERLGWLQRASLSGRFTSDGLDFELRAGR